jgi:hypothetical protein
MITNNLIGSARSKSPLSPKNEPGKRATLHPSLAVDENNLSYVLLVPMSGFDHGLPPRKPPPPPPPPPLPFPLVVEPAPMML